MPCSRRSTRPTSTRACASSPSAARGGTSAPAWICTSCSRLPIIRSSRIARRRCTSRASSWMRQLPKPIVALVQGRALAGGCGLATACDLILAAESAEFGYPEVQRGFVPAIVMTMLRRVVGEKIAFDLAATGRLLDGTEAAALGLASRLYEDADFEEQAGEVLRVL